MAGIGGWNAWGTPGRALPRIQIGSPAYPRVVSTPQTAAAYHRAQRASPVRYAPARNVVSRSGRVQPRWSTAPVRRYALRKAQTGRIAVRVRGERDIVASGLDAHMRTRTDAFLGRL